MTADAITGAAAPPSRGAPPTEAAVRKPGWLRSNRDLLATPIIILVLVVLTALFAGSREFDSVAQRGLNPVFLWNSTVEHLVLTAESTLIVMVVAIPLGIVLSRDRLTWIQVPVITIGGFLQALPPLGVLILIGFGLGLNPTSAVLALALASLLPVLTNTVIGLRQVNPALIEAARGMGMSARRTLLRVELPLAVPVMVAGIRVALVLNVGTAALAVLIGGGGLGSPLISLYKLARFDAMAIVAIMIAILALLIDWLAGLAERLVAGRNV